MEGLSLPSTCHCVLWLCSPCRVQSANDAHRHQRGELGHIPQAPGQRSTAWGQLDFPLPLFPPSSFTWCGGNCYLRLSEACTCDVMSLIALVRAHPAKVFSISTFLFIYPLALWFSHEYHWWPGVEARLFTPILTTVQSHCLCSQARPACLTGFRLKVDTVFQIKHWHW